VPVLYDEESDDDGYDDYFAKDSKLEVELLTEAE